jgi:hypothetical protein
MNQKWRTKLKPLLFASSAGAKISVFASIYTRQEGHKKRSGAKADMQAVTSKPARPHCLLELHRCKRINGLLYAACEDDGEGWNDASMVMESARAPCAASSLELG